MTPAPQHCEHECVCYHMLEEVMTPCHNRIGACPYDTRFPPYTSASSDVLEELREYVIDRQERFVRSIVWYELQEVIKKISTMQEELRQQTKECKE